MNAYEMLQQILIRLDELDERVQILEGKKRKSIAQANKKYTEEDELYPEAKQLVLWAGYASATFLQRRLTIGYARACRLLDFLEEDGVIGPEEMPGKPRKIIT